MQLHGYRLQKEIARETKERGFSFISKGFKSAIRSVGVCSAHWAQGFPGVSSRALAGRGGGARAHLSSYWVFIILF